MRILNVEDDTFKHNDICKVLRGMGLSDIQWENNLESGIKRITEEKFDLIITDMYYPLVPGGQEEEAGELLVSKLRELQMNTPVIVCSSVRIRMPGILGSAHYSKSSNWEMDLRELVKNCL